MFHLDVGTQYAAGAVLCLAFGTTLYLVARRFPHIRGAFRLAEGFLLASLAIFAFLLRGRLPLTLSVLLANGLLWLAYLLFYTGVASLLEIRPRRVFPASVAIVAFLVIGYFAAVDPRIVTRIVVISLANCLIQANMLVDLLRYERRTFVVKLISIYVGAFIVSNLVRAIATVIHGASSNVFEFNPVQALYTFVAILGGCSLGTFCLVLIGQQITAGIEQNARRDSLTGAHNRLGIEELMAEELERFRRTSVPLFIALLDVDHFKAFNDSGGHAAGDDVLRAVVAAVKRHLRPFDSCGRMGGDEFLILLPGSSAAEASDICDRMRREISVMSMQGRVFRAPTVSIGIARADVFGSPADILVRADHALYAAKQAGRNCARMDLTVRNASYFETLPAFLTSDRTATTTSLMTTARYGRPDMPPPSTVWPGSTSSPSGR